MTAIATPEHFPDSVVASGFKMPSWIRTFTGKCFSIPRPRPEEICLEDIAHGLAVAPRWGAQSRVRYPVLAHCLYVAQMLPLELAFDGLMHDSSEAYFCDLPAPYKRCMPEYKRIEHDIMGAISEKLDFSWPPPDLVKAADAVALYEERRALFNYPVGNDVPTAIDRTGLTVPQDWDFEHWEWETTATLKKQFLMFYDAYRNLRQIRIDTRR